jgi:hypothetical protein
MGSSKRMREQGGRLVERLVNTASEGVFILDAEDRLEYLNESAAPDLLTEVCDGRP